MLIFIFHIYINLSKPNTCLIMQPLISFALFYLLNFSNIMLFVKQLKVQVVFLLNPIIIKSFFVFIEFVHLFQRLIMFFLLIFFVKFLFFESFQMYLDLCLLIFSIYGYLLVFLIIKKELLPIIFPKLIIY